MTILQRRSSGIADTVEQHDFKLLVEAHGAASVIAGVGELDIATVPPLRTALTDAAEAPAPKLVVDLTDVTFIDSVGVGAILHAKRRVGPGGEMAVVVPHASYARVIFETVGADKVLPVFATRDEALAHLAS
jgi:anti-sigma B factor antagonist